MTDANLDDSTDVTFDYVAIADGGHDGIGWYYWDTEYPGEGSVGAFATREEAEAHAKENGYGSREGEPLCNCHPEEQTGNTHRHDCPAWEAECCCYEANGGHEPGCPCRKRP